MDGALDEIATATRMTLCSSQPANFAGIAAVALADPVIDSGDFAKANGDTSGRKVTVGAQNGVTVAATGTGKHVALDAGTKQLFVATSSTNAETYGGTRDTPKKGRTC